MKLKNKAIVVENKQITENAFVLSWERNSSFTPGQHIGISLQPTQSPRLYSIASGNDDELIQVLYVINPTGELTPQLSKLKPNAEIFITSPQGKFSIQKEEAWLIANGSGIAPFRSFLRSGNSINKTIIHGVRQLDSFYFQEEFLQNKEIQYLRCCSKENNEGIFSGRVTDYLRSLNNIPVNIKYLLCGSTEMVVEVRDILISKKVPFGNIISEIYF